MLLFLQLQSVLEFLILQCLTNTTSIEGNSKKSFMLELMGRNYSFYMATGKLESIYSKLSLDRGLSLANGSQMGLFQASASFASSFCSYWEGSSAAQKLFQTYLYRSLSCLLTILLVELGWFSSIFLPDESLTDASSNFQ